nr:hypothetical protein Itr_chr11CG23680 [Ipomoea trifida]
MLSALPIDDFHCALRRPQLFAATTTCHRHLLQSAATADRCRIRQASSPPYATTAGAITATGVDSQIFTTRRGREGDGEPPASSTADACYRTPSLDRLSPSSETGTTAALRCGEGD